MQVHDDSAGFFDGDSKTVFDKYGDQLFYGTMLFGSLVSLLAALWKFMSRGLVERPLLHLYPLMNAIGEARDPSERRPSNKRSTPFSSANWNATRPAASKRRRWERWRSLPTASSIR